MIIEVILLPLGSRDSIACGGAPTGRPNIQIFSLELILWYLFKTAAFFHFLFCTKFDNERTWPATVFGPVDKPPWFGQRPLGNAFLIQGIPALVFAPHNTLLLIFSPNPMIRAHARAYISHNGSSFNQIILKNILKGYHSKDK